ncbi:hypothetical protein PAT3040_03114 [Paenibacillus agaridevorans]|uniref:Yip1 domain-containing protein n=1 Tax=Paenibacillus agaridevorans TaxID=171404 RepID=A0A2R5EPM3_9BACL|nr:YIP1 family protein [Paenibacillus agaridevorans]GBG08527.1 hypothetical protein PAT3040_03114 [Paenibacillus agaridevorans]
MSLIRNGFGHLKVKVIALLCLLCLLFPSLISAGPPYRTVYIDHSVGGMQYYVQPIYLPEKVIDGNEMAVPLSTPSDLFVTGNGDVYVADTGNNRIVQFNEQGQYIRSIGDEEGLVTLNQPEGVFVAEDGAIYAANTAAGNIVKFNAEGQVEQTYDKPPSNVLGDDYHFLPTKVVVDARGVMYVVVKDTHQGLLRMNPEGEFTGFFGANKTKLTWLDQLKRSILSKEMLAKEIAKRPNSIQNVTLTGDGFLFTTSTGKTNDGQIKKLNAGGFDAFQNKPFFEYDLVDTAYDSQGFLYGMDRVSGNIAIYDPTGDLLFYLGGADKNARQLGMVSFASSLAVNANNDIWVADSGTNLIHIFKRTSFGDTFLNAAHYYYEGDYAKSKPYWEEVIRHNGMLNISFNGLGKIALHDRDYELAIDYFKQSYDAEGYSDAFWSLRYEWLQRYFFISLVALIVLIGGLIFLFKRARAFVRSRTWHPKVKQYGSELGDAFYLIFHPYNGFYRLKERNISWFVIILIVLLAIGVHIWSIFGSGFIAHPFNLAWFNVRLSLLMLIAPWLTWIIANYLVSSVKGGEGRFREVLQASTFAIVPFIVMTIPATLLSNVLVLEEWIVIDLIHQLKWLWIILLLFVMTQVIHNFDFLESFKNAGITLFTIGVMWIFIIIFVALSGNLLDFFNQVYREVINYG